MPKVSVIVPTYNRAQYLSRALQSVFCQTFKDFEIIVIDDGSVDNTQEILGPFKDKIKYIYQMNSGVSAARNRGIKESLGQYMAFLDSDDEWIAEKLSIQVPILDKDGTIGIVYSKATMVNEKNERCGIKPSHDIGKDFRELVELGGDLPTSTVMTRRECFDKAGLFDESFSILEDFDMWIRIARHYNIYQVVEPNLAFYHCHEEQTVKNKIKVLVSTVDLDKKILRQFEDIPKVMVQKRLAANEYILSRACYNENKNTNSFNHLIASIYRNPFLGASFINADDNSFKKAFKYIKPYLFLIACSLKLLLLKTSRTNQ